MKTSTTIILTALALVAASQSVDASSNERQQSMHNQRSREEDDEERYRKPFTYITVAVGLSVAPLVGRFVVCLFTDPVIPQLFKAFGGWSKRLILERFGSSLGRAAKKEM